ncbi:hypothetical protein [Enterococcus faecalis]|uniref:hypothetical protein n=1 Tax=Enterococcus faecalis TaxID=1351 RepID=UPI00189824DA|nr:hypothetical protein [Enterococcus faecalis]
MTRKEKLNQAKRLADLWYRQQKNNYTLRNKKSAEELHDEKSDYAAKQIVAKKYTDRGIIS